MTEWRLKRRIQRDGVDLMHRCDKSSETIAAAKRVSNRKSSLHSLHWRAFKEWDNSCCKETFKSKSSLHSLHGHAIDERLRNATNNIAKSRIAFTSLYKSLLAWELVKRSSRARGDRGLDLRRTDLPTESSSAVATQRHNAVCRSIVPDVSLRQTRHKHTKPFFWLNRNAWNKEPDSR